MANISYVGEGKVVLIAGGGRVYTDIAARFVGSRKNLDDILASEYDKKLVNAILSSGHLAATEFDTFLFGFECYARVTEVQLVRKRIASYMFGTGRKEFHGDRPYDVVIPPSLKGVAVTIPLEDDGHTSLMMDMTAEKLIELGEAWYNGAVAQGVPEEEARYLKPQATAVKGVIGMNAHGLLDWFKIRMCNNAQTEIRDLATKMCALAKAAKPDLFAKAGANCVALGYCPENKRQCQQFKGIIPTHTEVLSMIKESQK